MTMQTIIAENEYDYTYDIYTITARNHNQHGRSIELEEGVILDLDENNMPFSIEILDISQRLNISKKELINAHTQMRIICDGVVLKVTVEFYYNLHEKELSKTFNSTIANNEHLPEMEVASV